MSRWISVQCSSPTVIATSASAFMAERACLVRTTGKNPWNGAEKDPTFRDGAITNIKNFIESIKTGKLLNNGEAGAESTLTGVLGRIAAYRQHEVSWEEMMRVNERFDGRINA